MQATEMSAEQVDRQVASFLALEPEAMRCPVHAFSALRDRASVCYVKDFDIYIVTGREEATSVLANVEVFSSASHANAETSHNFSEMLARAAKLVPQGTDSDAGGTQDRVSSYPQVPPYSDPPKHTRQRRLLLPAFSTRKARAAEPVLRESANSLIDNFISEGNVELRSQFTDPLMVRYVLQELHCSPDEASKLLGWADQFARLQGSRIDDEHLDNIARTRVQFDEYFEAKIAQVRENPTDDVLSKLVHAEVDGDSLSTGEVLMICQTLLVGGTETSSSTTNNALLYLADNPELADRLRADNSLIAAFVEESLRLNGPIHMLFRQAKAESTLGGVTIPKGARVGVHLGAAGRDQDRCPVPDEYDLTRHQPGQIMFGWGPHLCAGAELARVQVRVAVTTLLQRLDNIGLAVPFDDIEYYSQINLRRIKSLPLQFSART